MSVYRSDEEFRKPAIREIQLKRCGDYLAGGRDGQVRHEYVGGQPYAMAGASARHNRIAGNIFSRLNEHLDGAECEPFIADMKIRVAQDLFYYPDVVVTYDKPGGDAYTTERFL